MKKGIATGILVFTALTSSLLAQELVIESFESSGQLSFNQVSNATAYRIEWAPSPAGPWTNSWDGLGYMPTPSGSSVTCSVAMCYRIVAELGISSVTIPAGTNSGTDPDIALYSLTLPHDLKMDATEITLSQWQTVYQWALNNGYLFDHAGAAPGPNHPVSQISMYDAMKWCNARSEKEGMAPCYTLKGTGTPYRTGEEPYTNLNIGPTGYRLPTYEEWNYAARGGATGTRFPWGNQISHANATYNSTTNYLYDTGPTTGYHPDYGTASAPAGSFSPNGYGLYDIVGNVSEWYWREGGHNMCGGGYNSLAEYLRLGRTGGLGVATGTAISTVGFRTVRPL